MTRQEFDELTKKGVVLLDGATGSNLRKAGMPVGISSEQWVLENPRVLQELQSAYVEAGSQIVYAPTFCLLYTSPSPRDRQKSRMPSSA